MIRLQSPKLTLVAAPWYKLGHCSTFLMSCFPSAVVHYDRTAYTVYIKGNQTTMQTFQVAL